MTTAFLFPGQGSQSLGMMDTFSGISTVKKTFEEASSIMGKDMWNLMTEGPEDQLSVTTNTQPLMLISDVSMYRVWLELGGMAPSVLAGHSLGEYAALVAAGALEFSDAVSLVRERSQLMQDAVPSGVGAMAAILGLNDDDIGLACRRVSVDGAVVEPANFNAPGQVVIAGEKAAVEATIEEAKKMGAKRAMLLAMKTPSHCSLIKPAAELFLPILKKTKINTPTLTVIHNENVTEAGTPDEIRERLYRQLFQPVRWVETIQYVATKGVNVGVECGPGKVLTGLSKRIDKTFQMLSWSSPGDIQTTIDQLSGE